MADPAWEPAAQVAKNPEGKFVALMGSDWVPVEQASKDAGGKFMVFRGANVPRETSNPAAQVAAETPEWERRAAAVGRSMSAPFEGVSQILAHGMGKGDEADAEARHDTKAMEELYKASEKDPTNKPTASGSMNARKLGIGADLTSGFVAPGVKAAEGANFLSRVMAGGATGGLWGLSTPTAGEGDFATEKAKQGGIGALLGGGVTAGIEGLARIPGVVGRAVDRFRGRTTTGPTREPGEGAEKVTDALQSARDKIEGKVQGKLTRAEQDALDTVRRAEEGASKKLQSTQSAGQADVRKAEQEMEAARAAPRGDPTATAGEFGALSRDVMAGRKAELEAVRDTEAMPLLDAALNSGAKVNVSGIPKQIDLMLKNEKNPDIERALLKAKGMLYAKDGAEAQQFAKFDLKTPEGRAGLAAALEAAEGKKQLDTSVRGLDSARLAIKSMLSGQGSDPADKFAQKQLGHVLEMLEEGLTKGSPEYGAYLSKYRELSKPLDAYSAATGTGKRSAAALQKDAFDGGFLTSPESMGARFFKSGDEGAAAARDFKQASGGDPDAKKAMTAYISGKLKDTAPEKWDSFLKKHESALKEFGLYDSMRTYEQSAVRAQGELTKAQGALKESMTAAEQSTKAEVKAAEEAAKASVKAAEATAKRVRGVLKESAIGKLSSDAAAYKQMNGREAQAEIEKILSSPSIERNLKQAVSATRGNPEAQSALRQSYMDWIAKTNAMGEIDTAKMLTNWRDTKGAIKNSGLFDPSHVQAMDKIMGELKDAYRSSDVKRAIGNAAGWVLGGGYKGAYLGRQIGGSMAKGLQKDLEGVVLQMAADPTMAANLASRPNAQSIGAIQSWLNTNAAPEIEKALAVDVGRESAEQKPRRSMRSMTEMQAVP